MTLDEIFTELEAHYAYDIGAVDSGVHDTMRRAELAELFETAFTQEEIHRAFSIWLREHYLSDDALDQGYGSCLFDPIAPFVVQRVETVAVCSTEAEAQAWIENHK